MDVALSWYTSIAGIVTVAILAINVLKKLLINVDYINKIPTWILVVIVAEILTFICNRLWNTLPGDNYRDLFLQALVYAAAASGFWEWLGELNTTIRQTAIRSGVNPSED